MAFHRTNENRINNFEFDFRLDDETTETIRVGYAGTWEQALKQVISCDLNEGFTVESFLAVREYHPN